MATLNVTLAGSLSSPGIREIERLQCRVENTLATALHHIRSEASPESINAALERVQRASHLLMKAQDSCRLTSEPLPLAA